MAHCVEVVGWLKAPHIVSLFFSFVCSRGLIVTDGKVSRKYWGEEKNSLRDCLSHSLTITMRRLIKALHQVDGALFSRVFRRRRGAFEVNQLLQVEPIWSALKAFIPPSSSGWDYKFLMLHLFRGWLYDWCMWLACLRRFSLIKSLQWIMTKDSPRSIFSIVVLCFTFFKKGIRRRRQTFPPPHRYPEKHCFKVSWSNFYNGSGAVLRS